MRRKFLLLFAALIIIGVGLSGGLAWQVGRFADLVADSEQATVLGNVLGMVNAQAVLEFCTALQRSLLLMALVLALGLISCLVFFLRLVILPLEELKRSTSMLADGHLDALEISIASTNGPIKGVLENIHDLAINLQEVLLLVWNLTSGDLDLLKKTSALLAADNREEHHGEIMENLSQLNSNLLDKLDLVRQFELFHVTIQEKKLFAEEDSDSADLKNCEESRHG